MAGNDMAQSCLKRVGSVAILRFDGGRGGCISVGVADRLLQVLVEAIADPAVRCIVLTGEPGGVFIRHADVGQIARAGDALSAGVADAADFANSAFITLCEAIETAPKPVIAAINGLCMGAGLEIALACTMRIANAGITAIGLPEIRIGLIPGAGGLYRLARLVGQHRARLLVLRGKVVGSEHALELGIIDEVVPDALQRALTIADELVGRAVPAIRSIMQLSRDDTSPRKASLAFAALLKGDALLRDRLHQFDVSGERLEELQ